MPFAPESLPQHGLLQSWVCFPCLLLNLKFDRECSVGTGAVSLLFHTFPYGNETKPMKVITLVIFLLNLVLFVVFTAITIARYFMFPDVWRLMMRHPVQSLYLGCFPMAGTTLINVSVTGEWE